MNFTVKGRISSGGALYLPKKIISALNLHEGMEIKYTVQGGKLIVEPIPDPPHLALKGEKFAEITFEEFENGSEEMQHELFDKA